MAGERDRREACFMVKWYLPLQVFKCIHVHSHYSTNHAKTIGLEKSSSSTTRGKNAHTLIKRALKKGATRLFAKGKKGKIF